MQALARLTSGLSAIDPPSGFGQDRGVRVLLINQVFQPDPQATGQYLSRVAGELARQGHEVVVLTGRHAYDDPATIYSPHEIWRGVEIIRVASFGLGHATKLRRAADYLNFLLAVFFRALTLRRCDLIVTLTTPPLVSVLGGLLARFWRCRFIYWVMDLNPDEAVAVGWIKADGLVARFLEACSRWSLRQADHVIVLDRYMRDRVAGKGIAPEKIEVVPPWMQHEVSFDPAGRAEFRRAHDLDNAFVVMYAGNHTPVHPLDTLFSAVEKLRDDPQIRFLFVGGGSEWAKWRDRAQAAVWKNALFIGYRPQAELAALLSAADLQVVVMGDPFVGIIHPCKVYNFLAAQRPFIYVGPKRSHIADLIDEAGVSGQAVSFRHGEVDALVAELKRRAAVGEASPTSESIKLEPWSEPVALKKLTALLLHL